MKQRAVVPLSERFWGKVDKSTTPDGCWTWTGYKLPKGYGRISVGRRDGVMLAHRAAFELTHGPIPAGMLVDHICQNPSCVRPEHLRLATVKQNGENLRPRSTETGVRGVRLTRGGKYQARFKHNYRSVELGAFDTLQLAVQAVVDARNQAYTHNDLDRV